MIEVSVPDNGKSLLETGGLRSTLLFENRKDRCAEMKQELIRRSNLKSEFRILPR